MATSNERDKDPLVLNEANQLRNSVSSPPLLAPLIHTCKIEGGEAANLNFVSNSPHKGTKLLDDEGGEVVLDLVDGVEEIGGNQIGDRRVNNFMTVWGVPRLHNPGNQEV